MIIILMFHHAQLVIELEHAYDLMKERKARGIQMIFSKFDSMRSLWNSAFHASAMLDALGALAQASTLAGFCRPQIKECSPSDSPAIIVTQGRHPCVDFTHSGDDFIPNDLTLGGDQSRVLLLR
jgi:DNA mismatch repair protein MSH6